VHYRVHIEDPSGHGMVFAQHLHGRGTPVPWIVAGVVFQEVYYEIVGESRME
jgi:hypothetical protein